MLVIRGFVKESIIIVQAPDGNFKAANPHTKNKKIGVYKNELTPSNHRINSFFINGLR